MIDVNKLKQVFPFINELNTEDILDFLRHVQVVYLNPGDVFLEEGSLKSNVYFVSKGLIRSYHINEKGVEFTNRLRYENQIVAPYEIIFFQQTSRFNFQALEHTELFVVGSDNLRQIVDSNPKLEPGRRFFLVQSLAESLKALDEFILLNPEERYSKFVKDHPNLLNRVPNKYIANILGITPVSLSRIRKRLANKKR